MIGLLPIGRVIAVISVAYAFFCILLFGAISLIQGQNITTWKSATFALSGATVLNLIIALWFYFGWRKIWEWFPSLNHVIYPDISGEWKMQIDWNGPSKTDKGTAEARAFVRQDFLKLSMEVSSKHSDSHTLSANPRRSPESGRPVLYYIYSVTTKSTSGWKSKTYQGSAILEFDRGGDSALEGNYWTSEHTSGRFRLYERAKVASRGKQSRR